MTNNKEAMMGMLVTMIRLGLVKHPHDYIEFLMWHRTIKNYSEQYGIKIETQPA